MAATDQLTVQIDEQPGETTIRLAGDLEFVTAPQLREALVGALDGRSQRIVLDVARLRYVDSSGLGVIVGGFKRAAASGAALIVRHPSVRFRDLLNLTALDRVFTIED